MAIYHKFLGFIKDSKNDLKIQPEYRKRKIIINNDPQIIGIELTNKCNFKCTFCPPFTRKQGFMDINLLENILKETKFTEVLVQLHFHGESLLHPRLGEMIMLCKNYGLKVGLSTNGSLLNKKRSMAIIESNLDQLIIAFDGVSKQIYEKYRVNANYEKVRKRILAFLSLKEQMTSTSPFVDLHVIKTIETKPLLKEFTNYWKETSVDQITIKAFSTRAGQVDEKQAEEKDWYYGKRLKRYACQWLWFGVIILFDGRVVPCCHDMEGKMILGDLKTHSMSEIWNSKRVQNIRKDMSKGIYEDLCKNCNEWFGSPPGATKYLYRKFLRYFYPKVLTKDNTLVFPNFNRDTRPPVFDIVYKKP